VSIQIASVLRTGNAITALSILLFATLCILVGPIDEGVQAVLLIVADIQRAWVVVVASSILGHTAATIDGVAGVKRARHFIIALQRFNRLAASPRDLRVGVTFLGARANILIIAEV
jgi:hypothetical protein